LVRFGEAPPLRYGFAVAHTFGHFVAFGTGSKLPALRIASPAVRFISYQVKHLKATQARAMEADAPARNREAVSAGAGADSATAAKPEGRSGRLAQKIFWFITYFWNLIKKQQPQGGLTIDSRWL
jgi:hypothetical protein